MVMEPFLEKFQAFHEQVIVGATVFRGGESPGQFPHLSEVFALSIVFGHHDGDGAFDAAAMERPGTQSLRQGVGEFVQVREKDGFLFFEMAYEVDHGFEDELFQ